MLCVFEDKNSKPQCFLRLGGEQCVGCRRSTDSDREHCIEVIKSDGGLWQFSAANHIEVADWLQCLCKAVSEGSQVCVREPTDSVVGKISFFITIEATAFHDLSVSGSGRSQ